MKFSTIRIEGGLFTSETMEQLLRGELDGQKAIHFDLDSNRYLMEEISVAWSDANLYWAAFQSRQRRMRKSDSNTSVTRESWLIPLLGVLGFSLTYQAAGVEHDGWLFPISHRAGEGEEAPPVQLEGFKAPLDIRIESGKRKLSPQALMQNYLNRSEHLWGIVSSGDRLRVLRNNLRSARPAYVEFNLEAMMEGGKFDEFIILYRLCHRSRFPKTWEQSAQCWLETYYQNSVQQGGRIRERLRDGVEDTLQILGNGFLLHPENETLRTKLEQNELSSQAYYQELLRLIYRLLFLMVAEERRILILPGEQEEKRQRIYARWYSVGRLRELCERSHLVEQNTFGDLWIGLQQTFVLFADRGEENLLGVTPLNGTLFGSNAIPDLEGMSLHNHDLIEALRKLSLFRDGNQLRRVNYSALDVEELGSVYESLLDYEPRIDFGDGERKFELKLSMERKSSGSYYTPPELVQTLLESALEPVMEERLRTAKSKEEKIEALLGMKICDPSCGSGHFLLAAARKMGRELAKIRMGEEEPTPEELQVGIRDVIERCLYGVDLNPLAVDLCKLALWIEGHVKDRPLSFLDHRIRCGNSLVGIFSMEQLVEGIPDKAFDAVTGDSKAIAQSLKKQNKGERKGQMVFDEFLENWGEQETDLAELSKSVANMTGETAEKVRAKAQRYAEIHGEGTSWWRHWTIANLWTSAFYAELTDEKIAYIPTTVDVLRFINSNTVAAEKVEFANQLSMRLRFFHWPLEFPEVFKRGGFDVLLGNPPWERVRLQEQEFFQTRNQKIMKAQNQAERHLLIEELSELDLNLWKELQERKHQIEAEGKFIKHSNRFVLCGVGDINTYALFAELSRNLTNKFGRIGIILPTNIATEFSYRKFFADIVNKNSLISLYDFENRNEIFSGVHRSYKFCLLTLSHAKTEKANFTFFCSKVSDINDDRQILSIAPKDLILVNPNTGVCPIFRTAVDAEITSKVYLNVPSFINDTTGENYWGISLKQGLFNMSTNSKIFSKRSNEGSVRLYEGKIFHQYNHRWLTFDEAVKRETTDLEKTDPSFTIQSRYWVDNFEVDRRIPITWKRDWLLVFRDIARSTDERTVIASIIPRVGVGHTAPLIFTNIKSSAMTTLIIANLNSICLDYIARQKIGGTHLTFSVLKQLPVLPPHFYHQEDVDFIAARVLTLTYTAYDLELFARDLGYNGPPFQWDEERRAVLRAELDAYYAHLYGLTRDELRYILDPTDLYDEEFRGETFRVLKKNELKAYGEYRTQRLVLAAYDELAPLFYKRNHAADVIISSNA